MDIMTFISTKIYGLLAVANKCTADESRRVLGTCIAGSWNDRSADLCLFVRGVDTVSGENGNCVDRKAESRLSTVSSVAEQHTHESALYKNICPPFALS
jgi:hypothetical protein